MEIRQLDTKTLDGAAQYYAARFIEDKAVMNGGKLKFDRPWVMKQLYNFTYKDEFEYIVARMKEEMGAKPLAAFEAELAKLPPRTDEVFHRLLAEKLGIGVEA